MSNFTKQSLIYSASKVIRLFISIAVSIIIARLLGPAGKGMYTIALLIPSLSFIFMGMGMGESIVYFVGQKRLPEREVLGTISVLYLTISAITYILLSLILGLFAAKILPGITPQMIKIALLMIFPYIFIATFDHFLLAKNRVFLYGLVDILNGLLLLATLVILYLNRVSVDAGMVLLAESIIMTTLCLYTLVTVLRSIGWPVYKNFLSHSREILTYGAKVNVTNILSFIHVRADSFMINFMLNPVAVGIYSIAVNLTEQIWLIPRSISKILFKEVSHDGEKSGQLTITVLKVTLLLSTTAALLLVVVGLPLIKFLYSDDFIGAYLPMCILLLGVVASSGSRIITSAFHGTGDTNSAIKASLASVPLNIGLNLFLIPWLGITGAAISTMISYSLIFIYRLYLYKKLKNLSMKDFLINKRDIALYGDVLLKILRKTKIVGAK